jgi:hypothetical protein
MNGADYEIEDDGRLTLVPTGDEGDTDRPPPPDFADTAVDPHEVHLFV